MRFAGKQERNLSWGCLKERVRLSERDEKSIPENTHPHSVLLRIEILHSFSVATRFTELGSLTPREGPLSTHLLHLLLTLEQISCSHVSCQLTGVYFQRSRSNNLRLTERLRAKKSMICVHLPASGAIFTTGGSHEIHISHRECSTSCMLMLPGGTQRKAHKGVNWCQKVRHKWSFGQSNATSNKFRLYSCCAHSLGCCKTLALALIKTLITERTGQIAA